MPEAGYQPLARDSRLDDDDDDDDDDNTDPHGPPQDSQLERGRQRASSLVSAGLCALSQTFTGRSPEYRSVLEDGDNDEQGLRGAMDTGGLRETILSEANERRDKALRTSMMDDARGHAAQSGSTAGRSSVLVEPPEPPPQSPGLQRAVTTAWTVGTFCELRHRCLVREGFSIDSELRGMLDVGDELVIMETRRDENGVLVPRRRRHDVQPRCVRRVCCRFR